MLRCEMCVASRSDYALSRGVIWIVGDFGFVMGLDQSFITRGSLLFCAACACAVDVKKSIVRFHCAAYTHVRNLVAFNKQKEKDAATLVFIDDYYIKNPHTAGRSLPPPIVCRFNLPL